MLLHCKYLYEFLFKLSYIGFMQKLRVGLVKIQFPYIKEVRVSFLFWMTWSKIVTDDSFPLTKNMT